MAEAQITPSEPEQEHRVEVITDEAKVAGEAPFVSVRTGQTDGKTIFFKIHQPKGRALLIAVHL